MKNKRLIFYISLLCILVMHSKSYSLQENTHRAINQHIAQATISGFSLDNYLRLNLGFARGYEEPIHGINTDGVNDTKSVSDWLGYGGEQEDRPGAWYDFLPWNETRSVNHFHNPLKTNWAEAGLSDIYSGQSSILWAQNTNQTLGGNWSWQDAKLYFYIALTGYDFYGVERAKPQSEKDIFLARTFRALGQQMHIVQDASVPEHARNDAHNLLPGYEGFVLEDLMIRSIWTTLLNNPITFNRSILNNPSPNPAPSTISRIIDTDLYNGENPGITETINFYPQIIGLAEYSNANFLGMRPFGSVPLVGELGFGVDIDRFPYPRMSDTISWSDSNKRIYLRKMGSGDVINHLAVASRLRKFLQTYSPFEVANAPVYLDDLCYGEYAQNLIPRAVGYSAGLLNYFFRGTLEITPPAQNVYAITDGSQTLYADFYGSQHQQFTKIKAKVRNNTVSGDQIGVGTLQAVAKYKKRIDYQPDLSGDPTDEHPEWGVSEDDFSYSVSTLEYISSLSSSEPTEFSFNFATNPIPAGITDLYLQVVFKGDLGNEADDAIAVGMKDLAEPAHHVFWNLSDQFSLRTEVTPTVAYYHLYTEDIISSPTGTLRNLVDLMPPGNPNGVFNEPGEPYIKSYPMTFEIAYINQVPPETTPIPVARVANLPAGQYIRLVMIEDREQPRFMRFSYSDQIEPGVVGISDQQFQEVINQTEPDGYIYYMPVDKFRRSSSDDPIRHHFYTGILRCYPTLSGHYCPYNETESIPADSSPHAVEILLDNN